MKLKRIQLEAFRNYTTLDLNLEANLTILIGLNAQGKTNLLESIAFLALGKSFRSHRSIEALHWDHPYGRIKGTVEEKGKELDLEIFLQRSPEMKKLKKGDKVATPKNFLGTLQVVLFTPDHLDLITGSPSERRQYLDRLLLQLNLGYVESFSQFQRILNHRNALLKNIQMQRAQTWELDLWDARLAEEAYRIWGKRKAFIDFLSANLQKDHEALTGKKESLTLDYHSHKDRFEERLISVRDQDIRSGSTSLGPHRDDFTLLLDKKSLKECGSRGQCRSAVLALKMAEIGYMEEVSGEKPLLLLDDVFSELDHLRQEYLGQLLKNHQSILTTTSVAHLEGLEGAKIYQVEQAKLQVHK